MMKKIISLLGLFAFLPAGARGADSNVLYASNANWILDTGVSIGNTDEHLGGDLVAGDLPSDPAAIDENNFYLEMTDDKPDHTLRTGGNITGIGELSVAERRALTIARDTNNNNPYNIDFNTMLLNGTLNVEGAGNFTSKNIVTVNGGLNVDAQTINLNTDGGATTVNDGATLILVSTGDSGNPDAYDMLLGGLMANGNAVTELFGKKIKVSHDISNGDVNGTMTINIGANMTVDGNITNNGTMKFTNNGVSNGGALTVTGTITNSGNMVLGWDKMPGGTGTPDLASLTADKIILQGDSIFSAVISGTTTITNGFDWSVMNENTTGTFNLETEKLLMGPNPDPNAPQRWLTTYIAGDSSNDNDLNNKFTSFKLAVKQGTLEFGNITNDTEMRLSIENIEAASITNSGKLDIRDYLIPNGAQYVVKKIEVTGAVQNNAGEMILNANETFSAGSVQNTSGTMILNGQNGLTVTDGITVSGGDTYITSTSAKNLLNDDGDVVGTTSSSGTITVGTGGITNTGGNLTMAALNLDVGKNNDGTGTGGISHNGNAGTTKIGINGMMDVAGDVNIAAGTLAVNALNGGTGTVQIGGNLITSGTGQIDFGKSVNTVTVGNSVDIGGNLLGGNAIADGNGNVYTRSSEFTLSAAAVDDAGDIKYKSMTVNGDVQLGSGGDAQSITLIGSSMNVQGGVSVDGSGSTLTFGNNVFFDNAGNPVQALNVKGTATVANGGHLVIKAGNAYFGALTDSTDNSTNTAGSISVYGGSITTTAADGIKLAGGIQFGVAPELIGLNIFTGSNKFALATTVTESDITVGGGVSVAANNELNVTSARNLTINGSVVNTGGTLGAVVAKDATFNSGITNTGTFNVIASVGNINTAGIKNSSKMELSASMGSITTGVIEQAAGTPTTESKLELSANTSIKSGDVNVTNGEIIMFANNSVSVGDVRVSNSDLRISTKIDNGKGEVTLGDVILNGTDTDSENKSLITISSDKLHVTKGVAVSGNSLLMLGGVPNVEIDEAITVTAGNMGQGNVTPTDNNPLLWLDTSSTRPDVNLTAKSLNISRDNDNGGDFMVTFGTGTYKFSDFVQIAGNLTVAAKDDNNPLVNPSANITANTITIGGSVTNNNILSLTATGVNNVAIQMNSIVNSGTLTLDSGAGIVQVGDFGQGSNTGMVKLSGAGLTSGENFASKHLYQNTGANLDKGDVAILSDNYVINVGSGLFGATDITQATGSHLTVNVSGNDTIGQRIHVLGNVSGTDITFALANPDWINIKGNVSGGTSFIGLGLLSIGGNYTFNDNSLINAAIMSKENAASYKGKEYKYWATITMDPGEDFGKITNTAGESATPLITVGGQFISDQVLNPADVPQVGIRLTDMVDQGDAIWLVHAEGKNIDTDMSPLEEIKGKFRNLSVVFCNADGSKCFDYYPDGTTSSDGLPAYLSVRDTDNDGKNDSVYVVFDPRFGGPVQVFQIQPIVDKTQPHTDNEYVSAGALDDWIKGKLYESGFYNRTPIEAIPVIFAGTNVEQLANELYARMERYTVDRDGTGLARFSRLVTPREVENLMGSISLNEHTNFRGFEDHMLNEFIWNRNRRLKNAWVDVDFGIFNQDVSDGMTVDGNRFSISGGFDWQHDRTTIFGLTARVSHMSMDNNDSFDLGYIPGQPIDGRVDVTVDNTNIGIGGYMIKALNPKIRLYGNLFADMHMLSVSRDMNYMSHIDGDGNAFAVTTEWGLMHDWLNQYIVGNLYARAGYNTGFSITERAGGADYMKLESDGYVNIAPGYTLTMQKRIYPSAWVQIRPYISAGVEYDVLGMPDTAKYKFASAMQFTDYDIDINPLWANFGGGVDVLSVRGFQVGLDYRYQYNTDIRMHNIRVSGSYRF